MTKQGYTNIMTMDLIKNSPEAGHLLVKLYDKHKLYALAKNDEPESRGELASIMAELMDIDLATTEHELITDVLMSLIRQAEIDLKQAIAERLSVLENVPLRLITHLANDHIQVADSILRRSRVLDDNDLMYIVRSQTAAHWRAIATRPQISTKLIDMLAETQDIETAITLSENKNIHLSEFSMNVFAELSRTSDRLARPLLMRDELPKNLAVKLYQFVGRELQEYIRENYKSIASSEAERSIRDVIVEAASAANGDYTPNVKMILAAESMLDRGLLNGEVMVGSLRRGQLANFIAMFSVYCGLNVETIVSILEQQTAQGLAIACRATGVSKSDFVNIFLLTSRVRGGRVIDQHQLGRALAYYDRIKESMAKKILNRSRH